jgi:hypothetical protein
MKASGSITLVVLALVALIAGGLGLRWILASPTGAVQQREQTIGNGSYRIQAYEAFYEECASAQTVQQNLANAITADMATNVDPMRKAQLDANVTALSNQLSRAVNGYNAHAREMDTRAHFLSSDLPYELTFDPAHPTTPSISCKA